jgi:hypothetical protein
MNTNMKAATQLLLCFIALTILAGCTKSTEEQMKQYIEFYYPTTGEALYEINFDWGMYSIMTGAGNDDELSAESEPYRGYITMRPLSNDSSNKLPVYLITKEGAVWTFEFPNEIAPVKTREEVTIEQHGSGTTTNTVTINSPLEAVVDHFASNPSKWKAYGKLRKNGDSYSLESK